MVRGAAAWLALALMFALGGPAWAETPEEAFERGNAAYAAGDWAGAASAYRTVLDFRVHDARVNFNLGNAEFRLRRLGPAILHFEKARRLDPADPEIVANLRFAQSFRFDRVEVVEPMLPVRALHRAQSVLGVNGQSVLIVVLAWVIAALLAWGLSRQGRFGPGHGWILAALLLVLALVGLSWWDSYERLELRQLAVVQAPAVELVAGPGPSNPSLLTIHEGLTVRILDEREGWVQVSLPNGINGWIDARTIGRV
jgi:tetratricopeptide (TPR) repeat protein